MTNHSAVNVAIKSGDEEATGDGVVRVEQRRQGPGRKVSSLAFTG